MNGRNKSDGRRAGIINNEDASYSHPSKAIWKSDPGCHELLLSEELLCSPSNLKKEAENILEENSVLLWVSQISCQQNKLLCIICLVTEKIYIEIKDNQSTPGYYL